MYTNKLILGVEVYAVINAALEVLKEPGHGLHEKPYENALAIELNLRGMPCHQQIHFDVIYKGIKVSEYVPDLIVNSKIVVDTKVIEKISDHERGRMINYLKITGLSLGLVLNFRRAKLEWERIVHTASEPRLEVNEVQ
jgi:GxxExxY protein